MVLDKSFVRKQTEFMENNLNIGIAKGTCGVQHTKKYVEFFEDVSYFAFCFRNKGEKAKVLGTGGSIYRSDVVRKVGGFDDKFRGVGEDIDLEARIRSIGWQLYMRTDALFYEKRRSSWRSLWKEYFWHGYGGYQMYRKTRGILSLYQLNPLAGFFVGALYSTIAFGLVYRKIVFLLPFQYGFKRIAWSFGFFSCQVKNQLSRARD
jgi:GT2 family glycosyltransferase